MATATQVRRVLLQIQADEGDSEAKIDRIAAKAEELGKLHPELQVKIDTAAASAKVKVLRDELRAAAVVAEAEPIKPAVEVDPAKARIAELQRQLARLRLEKQGITIGVDASEAEIKIAELKAQIDALGNDTGVKAADAVNRGFRLRMRPAVAGWGSLITLGLAGLPMAAAAVGALAGAALGAKLLIGTKKVQGPLYAQFNDMMGTLTSVMRVAALPLVKPLAAAFAQIGLWAKQMEPLISRAFAAVGPLVAPLARALEGLVSGVLPGFITLMRAAAPGVAALSGVLGTLSRAVGGMLAVMGPSVRASAAVWTSLSRVVSAIAPVAARLAGSLASALAPALRSVAQVVTILAPVLSRVGGLLAQLAGAGLHLVARALVQVLPPAARMLSVMASGLMPLLPPLIAAVSQVAQAFTGQLGRSLTAIMPPLQQLLQTALGLLRTVVLPLLGPVLQLSGLFTQLNLAAITPLLVPVIQLANVLLKLTNAVLAPMMPVIERITNALVTMANAAVTALSLLSRIPGLGGLGGGGAAAADGYGGTAAESLGNAGEGGYSTAGYSAGVAAGSAYGSAWADGATTAAKKAAAKKVTRASLAASLAGVTLAGSPAQVRAAIGKLITAVTQDERAGVISKSQGSDLTLWLEKDSTRLQALAVKRQKIMQEIAAAQKYAANVASSIRQADGLQSAAAGGWNGGPQTTGQIIGNLRLDVASIKRFAVNIRKLQKLGLNRAYLDQLIQMGPDAGGQLAEQLANSGLSDIKQINAAESQISQVSGFLGKTAANAMYDSGKMAGKGFLSGLEAQQSAITKLMAKIAKAMIDTLKHELGIHSPSTVTRDIARLTGAGIPLGLDDSLGLVRASAGRLARAMVPQPHLAGAGGAGSYRGTALQVEWVGGHQADQQFMTWLKKNIRFRGGDPAVTGR